MHGVLCHVGEAGHGVRARGAGRSGAAAGLATPGAGEPGSRGARGRGRRVHTAHLPQGPGAQEDSRRQQKWQNFGSHKRASVRRPNLSRHIMECSKCHENHCFLIFFLERLNEVIYGSYPS